MLIESRDQARMTPIMMLILTKWMCLNVYCSHAGHFVIGKSVT